MTVIRQIGTSQTENESRISNHQSSKFKMQKTKAQNRTSSDTQTLKMLDSRDKPKRFPPNPAGPQFYSLDRV